MNYRRLLMWAASIILIVVVVYLALTYLKKAHLALPLIQNGGSACEITFFYSPGCGYCTAFKPTWKSVIEADQGRSGCHFKEIDATQHEALASQEGVSAFPTVIKKSAGRHATLVGNQDATTLRQFIQAAL